jgi:hypothetical protein
LGDTVRRVTRPYRAQQARSSLPLRGSVGCAQPAEHSAGGPGGPTGLRAGATWRPLGLSSPGAPSKGVRCWSYATIRGLMRGPQMAVWGRRLPGTVGSKQALVENMSFKVSSLRRTPSRTAEPHPLAVEPYANGWLRECSRFGRLLGVGPTLTRPPGRPGGLSCTRPW